MNPSLIAGIQKRIWLVALTFVVSLSVAVVTLVRQVPVYRSQVTVELPLPGKDESELQYATRMNTRIATAMESDVIAAARGMLDRPAEEVGTKIRAVSAARVEGTSLVKLTVDGYDPVLAAAFANAWSSAFIESLPAAEHPASRLSEPAVPPSMPISPRKQQTIFLAALVGLVAGLLLAGGLTVMEMEEGKRSGDRNGGEGY